MQSRPLAPSPTHARPQDATFASRSADQEVDAYADADRDQEDREEDQVAAALHLADQLVFRDLIARAADATAHLGHHLCPAGAQAVLLLVAARDRSVVGVALVDRE